MASDAYKTSSPLLSLPSAANGVSVTPAAVSYDWSAWVQLTASASADMRLATIIALPGVRELSNYYEVEIGTGAAASETPVAAVRGYSGSNAGGPADYSDVLHLAIPADVISAGQRVSCRLRQASTTTTAWRVSIQYWARPVSGTMPASTIGPVNVPSGSVLGPVSGAAGAFGSWLEVTASADGDWTINSVTCLGPDGDIWELEIGIGAAGSEVPFWKVRSYADWFNAANAFQGGPYTILLRPALGPIPAGSRVAVRIKTPAGSFPIGMGLNVTKQAVSGASSNLRMLWSDWTTIASAGGGLGVFTPWTTIIAETDTDIAVSGMAKTYPQGGLTGRNYIQLAVGEAGEEVLFAEHYVLNGIYGGGRFNFPLSCARLIPAGSRVSLRFATEYVNSGVLTSFTLSYQEILTEPDFDNWSNDLIQRVYLNSSPINTPITITTGGSAWANGAWTPIDASVIVNRVITAYQWGNPANGVEIEVDIGIGSAGNETVVTTVRWAGSLEPAVIHDVLPMPAIIPAASRLSLRARCSASGAQSVEFTPHYTAEPTSPIPPEPDPLPGTTTFQIRRVRRTPTIFSDGKRVFHRRLQIEMQPGVGTVATPDPKVQVRTSDDGGLTWSSVREMSPGSVGQYQKLMRLFQLGSSYNRPYEIAVSDPVAWCLVNAYLDLEGGRN